MMYQMLENPKLAEEVSKELTEEKLNAYKKTLLMSSSNNMCYVENSSTKHTYQGFVPDWADIDAVIEE